jgi:two-component system phosphate regulon sensor histidine kinase PhoR
MNDHIDDSIINPELIKDNKLVEEAVLNSMVEGVITLECSGKVYSANPSALSILNMDKERLLGADIGEMLAQDPVNKDFYKIFTQIIQEAAPTEHRDVTFTRNDGQKLELAISASFIEVDFCVPGAQDVVVVFRDITAFKSMELMRRRAVDHLSHELKTPISVIQATVQVLMNRDSLDEPDLKRVRRIQRHLKRLSEIQEIVEEILNPRPYDPKPFNVNSTLEEVAAQVRGESAFRDLVLETDITHMEVHYVDPEILEICAKALLKNAIENSPDGSVIHMRAIADRTGLRLEVEDRGIGATVVDQEFIFDGFHHTIDTDLYQSKRPYEFGAGGKGLELMRLKTLSESHPFQIGFTSDRCRHIPTDKDLCPGNISHCEDITDLAGCQASGGSRFVVTFSA